MDILEKRKQQLLSGIEAQTVP